MKCSICNQIGHNKRSCNEITTETNINLEEVSDIEPSKTTNINVIEENNENIVITKPYPIVDLRGMGGKEKEIIKLFPNFERVNKPLYDFIDEFGNRYETKKTQFKCLQSWIDPIKYIDLSEEDKNIIFRFIYYDKKTGECLEVVDTTLGKVVERFIPDKIIEPIKKLAECFPTRGKLQLKLDIKWRKIFKK